MSSHCHRSLYRAGLVTCLLVAVCLPGTAAARVLRVCSDPDNLPFSNDAGQGFENRIAELLARDLNARLEYTWTPQRKAYIEHSLNENRCDVLIGIPAALDSVLATIPYYRSSYVFVFRKDRNFRVSSLNDARLSQMRIGIHMVDEGYTPPAEALARRGLAGNLIGFKLQPPAKLIHAVALGDIDIAVAWGPLAGYFAQHEAQPLELVPVSPSSVMAVPFAFDISAGVRKGNLELKRELDGTLHRECAAIQKLLAEYRVPQQAEGGSQCEDSQPLHSASLP